MAVIDRLRDRLRGQQPVGAAGGMIQQSGGTPDGGGMPGGMMDPAQETGGRKKGTQPLQHSGASIDAIQGSTTQEAQDAYELGRRMGLESLNEMQGDSIPGEGAGAGGRIMTKERLNSAMNTLLRYRAGKSSVNKRIKSSQEWWKLNNWDIIEQMLKTGAITGIPKGTAWLWHSVISKHADAMDSFPEPNILPRFMDDEQEAKQLSSVVPVAMDLNDFEATYSEVQYQKLREGTGAYGVFWDSSKMGGLGDIAITKVNMLNLYWEPGINKIQDSRAVFFVSYVDKDLLYEEYPELKGKPLDDKHFIDKYKTDDSLDLENKAVVVDWYYKKRVNGRTVLHYCKFVGTNCLYSSEELAQDPQHAELQEGYYHDGNYPFVLDPLFPVEGSPAGYGYTDIAVGEQIKTDLLDDAITLNAIARSRPQYFVRQDGSINEEEFMDLRKPLKHTNGSLGTDSLRPVEVPDLGAGAMNTLQHHIEAIKQITGAIDVSNGSTPQGVTAASGIAALQEAAGKTSKDSNKAAYRAYKELVYMVIERLRQFYTVPRIFRITGEDGTKNEYVQYDNSGLQVQQIPNLPGQEPGLRMPVFDIEVHAQRETVFNKMANNDLAIQLWGLGAYNPNLVDQVLMMLEMMDFRGKDKLKEMLQQQGTIREVLQMVAQIALEATKDKPQIQAQLAQVLQGVAADVGMQSGGGIAGMMTQKTGGVDTATGKGNENAVVSNARDRVAQASRPS